MSLHDMTPDTIRHLTDDELANSILAALNTALPYPILQVKQSGTVEGYVETEFEVSDPEQDDRTRVVVTVRVTT